MSSKLMLFDSTDKFNVIRYLTKMIVSVESAGMLLSPTSATHRASVRAAAAAAAALVMWLCSAVHHVTATSAVHHVTATSSPISHFDL